MVAEPASRAGFAAGTGSYAPTDTREESLGANHHRSSSNAWAVAATNGDLRSYCREQPGEWIEISISDDSEQIDQDGSLLLEALYEQRIGQEQEPEAEEEEPEAEDEEPDAEEEEPKAEEEEPEAEEEKPRPRSRARTKARKK